MSTVTNTVLVFEKEGWVYPLEIKGNRMRCVSNHLLAGKYEGMEVVDRSGKLFDAKVSGECGPLLRFVSVVYGVTIFRTIETRFKLELSCTELSEKVRKSVAAKRDFWSAGDDVSKLLLQLKKISSVDDAIKILGSC